MWHAPADPETKLPNFKVSRQNGARYATVIHVAVPCSNYEGLPHHVKFFDVALDSWGLKEHCTFST